MNYYEEIKNKLIENENYARIKDYSKEKYKVKTYFEIGQLLLDAGKHYGENIIGQYALLLQVEVGKKYHKRTLFRMRQFYVLCKNLKVSPVGTQLSWSHFKVLLPIKDKDKIHYYIRLVERNNLTKRELEDCIKNRDYERLDEQTKIKFTINEEVSLQELIKNPIILKTNKNIMNFTENDLQNIILENIPYFLKELGPCFSFIENEYKIKVGDRYYYIDLLLYNYRFNCFVVIELKITELKKEHIGQINMYMKYIDKNLCVAGQNETIGIIISRYNNRFVMEYCSDPRVLSREFLLNIYQKKGNVGSDGEYIK